MVQKYVNMLSKIVENAVDNYSQSNLIVKHFFSGAAAYFENKIFCTYTPVGIALKLPQNEIIDLIHADRGSELRYFEKAPIKKDYVVISDEITNDPNELNHWFQLSVKYVKSL